MDRENFKHPSRPVVPGADLRLCDHRAVFLPLHTEFSCALPDGHEGLHLSDRKSLVHLGGTQNGGRDQAYYAAIWDAVGYKVLMEYPARGNERWDPAQPG